MEEADEISEHHLSEVTKFSFNHKALRLVPIISKPGQVNHRTFTTWMELLHVLALHNMKTSHSRQVLNHFQNHIPGKSRKKTYFQLFS